MGSVSSSPLGVLYLNVPMLVLNVDCVMDGWIGMSLLRLAVECHEFALYSKKHVWTP